MRSTGDLQLRIMRELLSPGSFRWNIRESYASMAEKLRVDEETVRRGINRAREIGFLREVQLILNPHLVGRELGGLQVEVDDTERKPTVISQIEHLDGVVMILNLIGRSLRASFFYRDEQAFAKTLEQIGIICNSKDLVKWRGEFAPCNLNLRTTDWRIIKALRKDPRRPTSDVASEVGVSTKTVKRRLTIMTEGKAFYLSPEINYDKYPGVACSFLITFSDPTKKAMTDKQIRARLKRLVFSSTDQKEFSSFVAVCLNMSEADEIHRWIQTLDCVKHVGMDLIKETILPRGYLDGEIEKHLFHGSENVF